MNDFLDRLADRSLELAEVVQPRPVSLFEPAPGPSWADSPPLASLAQTDPVPLASKQRPGTRSSVRPAEEQTTPTRSSRAGDGRNQDSGRGLTADVHAGSAGELARPLPQIPNSEEESGPPAPELARPLPQILNSEEEPGPPAPGLAAVPRADEGTRQPIVPPEFLPSAGKAVLNQSATAVGEPREIGSETEDAGVATRRASDLERGGRENAAEGDSSAAKPGQPVRSAPAPEPRIVSVAQLSPKVALPATVPAQPASRSTAPPVAAEPPASSEAATVQVTIGRVEVRAARPTVAASKRQPPKPPVMGLEEYLRRRDSGGGR